MHMKPIRMTALVASMLALAACSSTTTVPAAPTTQITPPAVNTTSSTPVVIQPANPDNRLRATASYPRSLDDGDDGTLTITLTNIGQKPISGLNLIPDHTFWEGYKVAGCTAGGRDCQSLISQRGILLDATINPPRPLIVSLHIIGKDEGSYTSTITIQANGTNGTPVTIGSIKLTFKIT
jgi:hypothetical protein